jgi:hypothetical protein
MLTVLAFACLLAGGETGRSGRLGLAGSENFVVSAPDQDLADQVLAKAETYREEIALEWLGKKLPDGEGLTSIFVELSTTIDRNSSSVSESPSNGRHIVWLTSSRSQVLGHALAHEVAHTVLATHFGTRPPVWIDEGIACRYDDEPRVADQERTVARLTRSNAWPPLDTIFRTATIRSDAFETYAAAVSITRFLLELDDKRVLVEFAVSGHNKGWDSAVRKHYRYSSTAELEEAWKRWQHAQLTGSTISSRQRFGAGSDALLK